MIHYRSLGDLGRDVTAWLHNGIPADIDLVVGIPRSGLLPAAMIAMQRKIPLTDIEGLGEKRLIKTGQRVTDEQGGDFWEKPLKVLVVDDTILSGTQMQAAKERVGAMRLSYDIKYAAVYGHASSRGIADCVFCEIPVHRYFEWNIINNNETGRFCVDIDGVLCRDPVADENDDGEKYRYFVSNVPLSIRPWRKLGTLVTCRLEKYRELTEDWLRRNGVEYDNLVMMDYPDMQARQQAARYADFKAEAYQEMGGLLFIESSKAQAERIVKLSGREVFCFETREMLYPGPVTRRGRRFVRGIKLLFSDPLSFLDRLAVWYRRG